ncbi:uncharacterized protein BJ212DRAFT_1361300 [Suillus subaureus]|uniref:Uncharacterized protein n=1 Tax=Suillus subaureus TaxID=48587 RepID=A0A9P7JCQ3_9AGAM|nr:uncharacterized protein BJ212DRAFT_1361300 [Suillus subaureus]KAG1814673.1 hypothetical protein BJ212DRAFT_1361300 [Suillus subaureus]
MDHYLRSWLHSDRLVTPTTNRTPHRSVRIVGIRLHWHTKDAHLIHIVRPVQFRSFLHKNPSKIFGSIPVRLSKPDK